MSTDSQFGQVRTGDRNGRGRSGFPLAAFAVVLMGCQAKIADGDSADPNNPNSPGTPGMPGSPPGLDPTDPGNMAPVGPGPSAGIVPPPAGMRRLTATQIRNSVKDIFGVTLGNDVAFDPEDLSRGFSSIGARLVTSSPAAVDKYQSMAATVSGAAFAADKRQALVGCAPKTASEPCIKTFIETLARRLFRRAPEPAEVELFTGLVGKVAEHLQGDLWGALQMTVAGMLQSPHFLYVNEAGVDDPKNAKIRRFTGYEMAARLSFALWNSTPDDELLDAAASGALNTQEGVVTQAKRLVASPRGRQAMLEFVKEHLSLDKLDGLVKDTATFSNLPAGLFPAMKREIEENFTHLWDGNLNFLSLFEGKSSYVNAELASFYGLQGASGSAFQKVSLTPQSQRHGLVTFGGLLALHASDRHTSPTSRGVFVYERLLCKHPPDPPDDVAPLGDQPESLKNLPIRERLAKHREDPVCAGCHAFFDPLGLALENYDAVGAYRTQDKGKPVDATWELDKKSYQGPADLAAYLRANPETTRCFAKQVFRSMVGHELSDANQGLVDALETSFASSSYAPAALFVAAVSSDGFRFASKGE